jgi:predicted nucleic acid-binding protein
MPRKQAIHELDKEARVQVDEFCGDLTRRYGRNNFYVDTGAIVASLDPEDQTYSDFFNNANNGFITSSYVLMETVRFLVKSGQHRAFRGPAGEREYDLAAYVLHTWLTRFNVSVIHVPEHIFQIARSQFGTRRDIGCDMNDLLSFLIVRGMGQASIVAKDSHFRYLGLTIIPEPPQ